MRGFVLLLVIDEDQAKTDHETIVKVYREFDVATPKQLMAEIEAACSHGQNCIVRGVRELQIAAASS
jgi:hypothetical protein